MKKFWEYTFFSPDTFLTPGIVGYSCSKTFAQFTTRHSSLVRSEGGANLNDIFNIYLKKRGWSIKEI